MRKILTTEGTEDTERKDKEIKGERKTTENTEYERVNF